jgi:6-pyruvoyltetrahydropterin/6-carboxytetrahydropterin synthase
MLELTVREEFDAAHNLTDYPGDCRKLHGHRWRAEAKFVFADDDLNPATGMAADFRKLKTVLKMCVPDHEYLNDVFAPVAPTAENIARLLFDRIRAQIPELSSLTIWESEHCGATYRPEPEDEEP